MVTPQTNIDLDAMAERFKGLQTFVICGHVSPDGDCIGSQLALYHALRSLGKEATCILEKADSIDDGLQFLPGVEDMVYAADFKGKADAFVACDVPTSDRMGLAAKLIDSCDISFTIDHHATPKRMTDWAYTDPDIAATSMIVWRLIRHLGVEATPEMAICAYTGLVTDTGCFQFQNTDTEAFQAASEMTNTGFMPSEVAKHIFQTRRVSSLQLEGIMLERMKIDKSGFVVSYLTKKDFEDYDAVKADADPLINVLRSIQGVKVACLLREDAEYVRGSFRAKDDTDVAAFARDLGGGGHTAAAGFTIEAPLQSAIEQVTKLLKDGLS